MAQRPTYEELEARVRELETTYAALKGLGTPKESEINFFQLADDAHDFVVIIDSEGRYTYANESAS
jgi:PAS domain-containing protein